MASLYSEARKNGQAWRIGLSNGAERRNILLGKMPKKTAESCLSNVERIIAANAAGVPLDAETARWTASIDDALHGKLVKAGVLSERQRRTLGKFVADYIAERSDWKPGTSTTFRVATDKIIEFFGKDTPLTSVTAEQCHKYKAELLRNYSQGYTAKNVEWAKSLFTAAMKRKLIIENPFEDVVAGRHNNPDKMYFVSVEEFQALIDACNSPKQRLIIALARYGGLRCPSELAGLEWSEVNWERNRFIVHSPKTEKQGKAKRTVPIFKELYQFFREAWEAMPEGVDRIFSEITAKKSLGSFIAKLAARAGIVLWKKPFQNMRSTRATELIEIYPAHIVNAWLGHTEAVAMKHYRQTTGRAADKFFEQAAGIGKPSPEKNSAKMGAEHARKGCCVVEEGNGATIASPGISSVCDNTQNNAMVQNHPLLRDRDSNPD